MKKEKGKLRYPIQAKATSLIAVLSTIIVLIAVIFYAINSSQTITTNAEDIAVNLSNTVARTIETDKVSELKDEVKTIVDGLHAYSTVDDLGTDAWKKYNENFEDIRSDPTYIRILECLQNVNEANVTRRADVSCVYIAYIQKINDEPYIVYLADSSTTNQYPPGTLETLMEANYNLLDDPKIGFPPFAFDSELDGESLTAGAPIYHNGVVVAYSMVDVALASVRAKQTQTVINLIIILVIAIFVAGTVGFFIVNGVFVRPVQKLIKVASSYNSINPEETHMRFSDLDMNRNDEIGDLAESLKTLEGDVYRQITKLRQMNEQLVASKEKSRAMTVLATTDGLTGMKNKIAYLKAMEKIDMQIASGLDLSFAIAMVDLNYLKTTNDKFGHEAGDMSLRILSKHLSEVFTHSPIYRIGGDEFAIILRNDDLNNRDALIDELYARLKETSNYYTHLPVSAAIGYALFDKANDLNTDEVFRHADQAMYDKKRQMKEEDNK